MYPQSTPPQKPKGTCIDCGTGLTNARSKRCAPCHFKVRKETARGFRTPKGECVDCHRLLYDVGSTRCRPCYLKHHEVPGSYQRPKKGECIDCGTALRYANTVRCRDCHEVWHAAKDSRPQCVDCGKRLQPGPGRERCWDCHTKRLAVRHAAWVEMQNATRGGMTLSLRWEILSRDNFACTYCFASPSLDNPLHVDHVVPVARGGTNDPSNLRTACFRCNMGKGVTELLSEPLVEEPPTIM